MVDFNQLGSVLGGILQQYNSASPQNTDQYNHSEVYNHYQQAANAAPEEMKSANMEYYQQMPTEQRQTMMQQLLGALTQHGIPPEQTGITSTQASPDNLAKVSNYVTANPNLMDKVFGPNGTLSSPIAKMALVGGLAYLASKMTQPK
ncbi:MAG TPA: hypothetical protein VF828_01395 [Patescibacteria group bacterium]